MSAINIETVKSNALGFFSWKHVEFMVYFTSDSLDTAPARQLSPWVFA
jgi:hypothetical protein